MTIPPISPSSPGSGRRFHLYVALAAASWTSFEYIALGPLSWMYGYGAGLETIPVHLALAKSGSIFSLWAPFVAGGLDRLSFWGNADPFNVEPLLFATLPTWLANGLHVFGQRFIAVYFTARVCEEQLGMDRRWSTLAGLMHACFSYFTVGEMMAFPAVPLMIWSLDRLHRAGTSLVWSGVAGALFSTFTTFSHSVPYLAFFAVAWTAVVKREQSPRAYGVIVLFVGGLALFDSPQLIALLYNVPFSHRVGWPPEQLGLSFGGLFYYQPQFDFFDQDKVLRAIVIYVPPSVLALASAVAWRSRSERAYSRLLLRVAVLYAALSLKVVFVLGQSILTQAVPWANGIYMGRFHALPASFMMTLALALGFLVLWRSLAGAGLGRALLAGLAGGLTLFLLIWPKISLFYPLMIDSVGEKNFQVVALEELRRADRDLFRVASVLELQPAYAYGQGLEAADGWANLYPRQYRELWLRVLEPLLRALPRNRDIFDPPGGKAQDHYIFLGSGLIAPGTGRMPEEDPQRALVTGFDVGRRFNLNLLSVLNVKYLLSEYPLRGEGLRVVHSPTPPPASPQSRDYATGLPNSVRPGHRDGTVWQRARQVARDLREAIEGKRRGKDIYIYANERWLPRYRFATRAKVANSGEEVLDELSRMNWEELRDTVVLEAGDAAQLGGRLGTLASGSVKVERYEADEIHLALDRAGEGVLVIANTWNPFWRAEVDDQLRPLVRANHAQLALVTRPGERRVRLWYAPPYAPWVVFGRLAHVAGFSR